MTEKPFRCPDCRRGFSAERDLDRHERDHHTPGDLAAAMDGERRDRRRGRMRVWQREAYRRRRRAAETS